VEVVGEEENVEEMELAEFASRALRAPKGGAFDRLLALHLVMSVTGEPLHSIIHACRAALALPADRAERLGIDKAKVQDVLTVAMNLHNARLVKEGKMEYYSIRWSFERSGKDGFKRYVEAWLHSCVPAFYEPREWSFRKEKREEYESLPDYAKFYYACKRLTPDSYQGLVSAFCSFAFPFIEELNQKVSTQISPITYQEVLRSFSTSAKKEGEEEGIE